MQVWWRIDAFKEGIYLWNYDQKKIGFGDYKKYLQKHHRKRKKSKLVRYLRTTITNKISTHERLEIIKSQSRCGDLDIESRKVYKWIPAYDYRQKVTF